MASDHCQRGQRKVDPEIWRACAGSLIHIPNVNSRVYYFPQGHIEQSSTTVSLSSMPENSKPSILCRVLDVSFLADVDTDEVFVKFQIQPLETKAVTGVHFTGCRQERNDVVSFAKVLTPSDANNGGGFSVPRFCADSIFPPLNFAADPPVQRLRLTDVHGEAWEFRHIYRGTPRRHLLTTGWSKFVNSKKLIAGDSVVFMRNKVNEELFLGIRRAFKAPPVLNDSWGFVPKPQPEAAVVSSGGGFSRSKRGRVPAEKVVEAVERAVNGLAFEVVYYPRPGLPEFVVAAEKVEVALEGVCWSAGMKVKMAQETEDGARLTWYNGTIDSLLAGSDHGHWRGSSWRMLQVAWDEPEVLQNLKSVNPWQVECLASTPPIPATFPPTKKFKGLQYTGLLTDGEGDLPSLPMGFSSMMGHLSPSYLNFNTCPAGMQGARQNPFLPTTSLPYIVNDNIHESGGLDDNVDSSLQKTEAVSTDLNIGSSSPSETPSPDSQNSVHFFGVGNEQPSRNLTKKDVTSFHLFGKVIQMGKPLAVAGQMEKPLAVAGQMEKPLAVAGDIGCTEGDDFTTEGTRNTLENPYRMPADPL